MQPRPEPVCKILELLAEADPEDEAGHRFQLAFRGEDILVEARDLANEEKFEEAMTRLDERLTKPGLAAEQKQWILLAKGQVYRKWPDHDEPATKMFRAAATINPSNTVESVVLLDSGVKVASDEHVGVAGHRPKGTVYQVSLDRPPKHPVLVVTCSTCPLPLPAACFAMTRCLF